ncbi:MAG: hemin uptake protein HemP [Fuerstiella sp.]|nr:hemin uptake protein HemP [Fuerstiella sp.]
MNSVREDPLETDSAKHKADQRPSEISFKQLSQGKKEVVIQHDGKLYRLRLTRKGGLILN